MKKMIMLTVCVLSRLNLVADDVRQPYIIHRGEEVVVVSNMPKFTVSESITNSFIFNNGEYIPPPYVVSVSNLAVFLNGIMLNNYESRVHRRGYHSERIGTAGNTAQLFDIRRIETTPESVAKEVDDSAERWVRMLQSGRFSYLFDGQMQRSRAIRDGESALTLVELARKAVQGDEQAKQELIKEMMLETREETIRPDWIERLANNTNLEARATRILEAKRDRERQEQEIDRQRQERREQLKRQREQQNP